MSKCKFGEAKDISVSVYLNQKEYDEILRCASKADISLSSFIREATLIRCKGGNKDADSN